MQIYDNTAHFLWCLAKAAQSPLQQQNPACTSWPVTGSLWIIPVPPQNSWTHCLYNLQVFRFSCQLPFQRYGKIICGSFAISYASNLRRAQTAAPVPASWKRPQRQGHGSQHTPPPRQAAVPPHTEQTTSPRFSLSPGNAIQELLLLPSHPPSCQHKQAATKPLSKINGCPAASSWRVATRSQFLFVFTGRGREGRDHGQSHSLTFHGLPKPLD